MKREDSNEGRTGARSSKKPQSVWQFAKTVFTQWLEDQPFELAGALSYYTLFSLAPLLIIAIAVAGFVFGREAAQNQVVETLQGLIGQDSAKAVQDMIQNQAINLKPALSPRSSVSRLSYSARVVL